MLDDIIIPFFTNDTSVLPGIKFKEKQIKHLRDEVNVYLRKIAREEMREERVNEAFRIMYTVKEFEQIADIISKNLVKRAIKWTASTQAFSEEGRVELKKQHEKTQKQIKRAIEVFSDLNLEKARKMRKKNKEYRQMAIELEKQHFERIMHEVDLSIKSSEMHLVLLTSFKIITSHATNIARILLPENDS